MARAARQLATPLNAGGDAVPARCVADAVDHRRQGSSQSGVLGYGRLLCTLHGSLVEPGRAATSTGRRPLPTRQTPLDEGVQVLADSMRVQSRLLDESSNGDRGMPSQQRLQQAVAGPREPGTLR